MTARQIATAVKAHASLAHVHVDDDVALLARALRRLRPDVLESPMPRWSLVAGALGHGSGVASAICVAVGLDPNEDVPPHDTPEWLAELLDESRP